LDIIFFAIPENPFKETIKLAKTTSFVFLETLLQIREKSRSILLPFAPPLGKNAFFN
jgi:hypothetical protein